MSDQTAAPFWRIRLVVDGALLHLASRSEPRISVDPGTGRPSAIEADWITDGTLADRLGYLSLGAVTAISWRQASAKANGPSLASSERQEDAWDAISDYVLANGGTDWTTVEEAIGGRSYYLRRRRDELIAGGVLIDMGDGQRRFQLWHRDDPARPGRGGPSTA